ncbi:MAG TPA: cytochrome c oxidase subunit II [Allosphingosinicella sp.]|nr:cytochrome c oxidase subunit II [Allosphingosinicella sp.]
MKTLLKLFAIAAAFGMAPAAAPAAVAPAPATANAAAPAAAAVPAPPRTAPTAGVGQPTEWIGLQPTVSEIGEEAVWFHDIILLPLITAISLFVLGLLLWVIVRYRRSANPSPSRNTHNTTLEIVWTLVPVLILVAIAVPSIRLLAHQYNPPRADLTVKVTGNQWYWSYEYPDMGVQLDANIMPDEVAVARGEPRQLAADERLVVPRGAVVKVLVTSNDVIHSWGVPAFWVKMDAVPGRLNETWFRADRTGVFYGVCYELCGARHGYMPIAVEVVEPAQFQQWIASRGGHMPGAAPAAAAAPTPAVTAPATGNIVAATETPATTNQSATR